jgi:RNA-directed DNA polymerase
MSDTSRSLQSTVTQRDIETEVAHCVGGVVSPVLANLFLHYAFDAWMAREFPDVWFERYVDDVVVHCVSKRQAHCVLTAIAERMAQVGLTLHPDKTRIVYCHDGRRRGSHEHTAFTFLAPRSGHAEHGTKTGKCSSRSCPRSARKP